MSRRRWFIFLMVMILSVIVTLTVYGHAQASALIVPDNYSTIQAAIEAASPGDTIIVRAGTYFEILTLNKSIILTAESFNSNDPTQNTTIIDGGASSLIATITIPAGVSPAPTIRGFVIRNGYDGIQIRSDAIIEHNYFNSAGDQIDYGENSGGIARNNVFFASGDDAIDLDSMNQPLVIENNRMMYNGDDGIEIRLQDTTMPAQPIEITIRDNTIIGCNEDGIQLIDYSQALDTNRRFVMTGNLIANCRKAGIGLMPNQNTVEDYSGADIIEAIRAYNNTFYGNDYGISGGDNLIAFNNIIANSTTKGVWRVWEPTETKSIVAYTLFYNNGLDADQSELGEGNIFGQNPRFVYLPNAGSDGLWGTVDDDFNGLVLQANSPAIDSGITQYIASNGEAIPPNPITGFSGTAPDLGWKELNALQVNTPTATITPSPTATLSSSDLIFADGFESGNLSAWTSSSTDLGDLSVSGTAALVGNQGMQTVIDDANTIYVTDDHPNAEPRYRARFYFDPNSMTMTSGDAHFIFKGFTGTTTEVLRVEFRNSLGAYQLRGALLNDSSTWLTTSWFTISDAPHFIELDWRAATAVGANNGGLTFWIDGAQQANVTAIDNDTWRIDRVRLGALTGIDAGTHGTYYFDAFESRQLTYIGPASGLPAPTSTITLTPTASLTPVPAGVIRFAVVGDYGGASQAEGDVSNLIKSWNPDFVVTTGDNNYPLGGADTIDQNIGQYYHEFIYPYIGSYGTGATNNRFFPALGNHDWETTNAQPYLDYFTLPGNERYYDFVWGPVHFFMIDSDNQEPDGNSQSSTQGLWLQTRLAASTSPWNLVYLHHPPYSSGATHGSSTIMRWPYQAWGADAVLAGHDHTYERIVLNGFPYFVDGLGGRSIYTFTTPVPGSEVRYNGDYGAMLVEAHTSYITFQFITRTGVVVDTFTLGSAPISTATSTATILPTLTSTPAFTFTPTLTDIATSTQTETPFVTLTPSATPLPTDTAMASVTATDTFTATATLTPSETALPTDTQTPSATATYTSTPTVTLTPSETLSPTATSTYTSTPSATSTFTPTASPTPMPDLIFTDGFESGNLSAWSVSTTDGGDLSVGSNAALTGSFGLQALIDDSNAIYVTDDSPNAEQHYRARFYFDPNSISMTSNEAHYIFYGYTGTSTVVLRMEFRFSKGSYQLRVSLRNDSNGWTSSSWFTIADTIHFMEIDWRGATASGASNGGLTLWIDGAQRANLMSVDNDTRRIDRVRLGAVTGIDNSTRGTYYFDAFESRRQTYIGP